MKWWNIKVNIFANLPCPLQISHLSRGLKSAGPGADPCVTANKASPRRGWVFDSTLGRQTHSPVFSPVSGENSKGRHSDGVKDSAAMNQKALLWFYFPILFFSLCFLIKIFNIKWLCFEENDKKLIWSLEQCGRGNSAKSSGVQFAPANTTFSGVLFLSFLSK